MSASLACVTLLVRDYDEAIRYFTTALGFTLREDTPLPDGGRWVLVAPAPSGVSVLLARPATAEQAAQVGNQTGGCVGFFLHTDDFATTYEAMRRQGVRFLETPRREAYGTVAVFADLYGNRWDLLQPPG